jgi:hypothetical protein
LARKFVNNDLESIWEEFDLGCLEVISWKFLAKYEENYEIPGQNNWCPRQGSERCISQILVTIITA